MDRCHPPGHHSQVRWKHLVFITCIESSGVGSVAMKVGILGAGAMAVALGRIWRREGHEVMLAFSREATKLQRAADEIDATTGGAADATAFADVLVLATGWPGAVPALQAAGSLRGKVLWSIVTPMKSDFSALEIGTTTSGSEQIASVAREARVVACWPPFAEMIASGSTRFDGRQQSLLMCGDEPQAKQAIAPLIEPLDGDVIDAGPLRAARFIEPTMMLLIHLAYGQHKGPLGMQLLRRQELSK